MSYVLGGFVKMRHVAVLASVGLLASCGGGHDGKSTQVAVKVNKDEITTLQVNEQLVRLPNGIKPEQVEPATRKIIGSLINQQLLVQQAIEHKLDRDPQVLGAIEAARLNILAQAYTQRVIMPQTKPTEEDVRKYYAENPALFADRKVYRLQELAMEVTPDQEKQVADAASAHHSLKQTADYLHAKNIAFSASGGVRSAEQLPLSELPKIAQLKPGMVYVFTTGPGHASAIEVMATESRPVDDKTATPVIEQYLANRKREELAKTEIERLRKEAKIEYVGDFAKFAKEAVAAAPAAADTKPAGEDNSKGIAALR